MPADTRIRRAKSVLVKAEREAEDARIYGTSRSTGLRSAYKIKATAADRVQEILSERPPRQ